ncbi:MAG: protein kinase domain-containing protein [Candidatus Acidiferrales bacterium]
MGEVYRAHDEQLDREVALKVLPAQTLSDETARARLLREARAAAALNHPGICTIHEVGEADGQAYIAMELVEGQPLNTRLAEGALPAEQVLRFGMQLAEAVTHAHDRGVVHRDLKSANVIITPESRAKVLDFGLAKRLSGEELAEATTQSQASLTEAGALLGTLAYMSPEQLRGQPADARTDIWALGVVLYEMATGTRPFQGQTGFELSSAILSQRPPSLPAQVPVELRAVIERCLEKEPARRYQQADELRAALEAIQTGAVAPWVAWRYRITRRPWLALAATVALSVAIGAALWLARPPALPFEERGWVLVADFENHTAEPVLDDTLEYALGRELGNSRFVNVVPHERIQDALRLMQRAPDTRIDAVVGRELCLRDGSIRALLAGRVEKFGGRYLLTVEVMDPVQGTTVASRSEEAAGKEQLMPVVRQLSNWTRETLGEATTVILQSNQRLAKVSTPSLRALELYTKAENLMIHVGNQAAEELLKQAIREDPRFASAYIQLAVAMSNQGKTDREQRAYAQRAFELADTTTEQERYFILGTYYSLMGQAQKAIAPYQALLTLHPDHFDGTNNLARVYEGLGRGQEAVPYAVRRAELLPRSLWANYEAAMALAIHGNDLEQAKRYVERARNVSSSETERSQPGWTVWLLLFPAYEQWSRGNLRGASDEINHIAQTAESESGPLRDSLAWRLAFAYLTLGKLKVAGQSCRGSGRPDVREYCSAVVALVRGDVPAFREALARVPDSAAITSPSGFALLLVRASDLARAERVVAGLGPSSRVQVGRAELALARARPGEAIRLFKEALPPLRGYGWHMEYFLAIESLARAWEQRGQIHKAVQVLEEAAQQRGQVLNGVSGPFWLRVQWQLAQLYRKTQREDEAQQVEAGLQNLLAYADPDHPILVELKRRRDER